MKTTTFYRSLIIAVIFTSMAYCVKAQFSFTNNNSLIPVATHSGCAVTVVDVNNDGLDDILIMDQSKTLILELQHQDGSYTRTSLGTVPDNSNVWGMAAADVDHNGWKDIATGSGSCYLFKLFSSGGTVTATISQLPQNYFVQNITFGDFNNDGWVDLEVCDDDDFAKIYQNNSGTLAFTTSLINTNINPGLTYGNDPYDSGNYGSVWTDIDNDGDLDLYIAHCRQSTSSYIDQRRRDRLFINDGSNSYTENAASTGLETGLGIVTGSVAGTTLTVTAVSSGTLSVGQHVYGTGIANGSTITALGTGIGGIGTYTLSNSSTTGAITITAGDFKQGWTTSFGDIDNDGDMDVVITNHGENGQIFLNDGSGYFTDITASSGFTTPNTDPIESVVEDFDNDGFLDILISGGGPNDSYFLYHNNGNNTFTLAPNQIPSTTNGMLSFGIGDLNHDGKIDIFASYGNVYNTPTGTADVLYLNTVQNANHFITLDLTGTVSNHNAIGARAWIYGPWGVQIREVRAGESYGTSNSMQLHFGLGSATTVDSIRIDWPSHQQTHLTNVAADQFVTIVEGGCVITGNIIPAGPYISCSGQTFNAPSGYASYRWSDGDTTQSTVLTTSGTYNLNVMVIDTNGCTSISNSVSVTINPPSIPTVTTTDPDSTICQGSSLTLTSSAAASYLWSNGDTTQSTVVSQAGAYTVSVPGMCQNWSSAPFNLSVFPAPPPVVTSDTLSGPGTATLTATGNSISWYDAPTGGTLLDTGFSFTTPVISSYAVYYAQDTYTYGGGTAHAGQVYHTGTSAYSGTTTNAVEIFDVYAPCILRTVKVYTNTAGDRLIELRDAGNNVLQSQLVTIPVDTSIVTLNFNLSPGTGYMLGTNSAQNNTSFGYPAPQLERSSAGVNYPYTVSNFLSITNSDQGNTRFYYFYDWFVEKPTTVCVSDRSPAYVYFTGIQNISGNGHIRLYPNPASGTLNIAFDESFNQPTTIYLRDVTGRVIQQSAYQQLTKGQTVQFDVTAVSAGTYILSVENAKTTLTQSVTVMQ